MHGVYSFPYQALGRSVLPLFICCRTPLTQKPPPERDYPLGTVDYTVLVTDKDGQTTALKPPVQRGVTSLRIID